MKLFLTILAYLMPLFAFAETTTDRLTLTPEKPLQPGGGEVRVTVSLEGSRIYTGYEMDITLPEGIELNYYKNAPDVALYKGSGCIYPFEEDRDGNKTFTHTATVSYGEVAARTIRIACISTSSQNFTSTSGKLLTIYLKASAFAKPGDVSLALSNCKLATFDDKTMTTTGYVPEQKEISGITVGNNATVPVSVTSQWGTLMLPFPAELPEGMKAYSCSSNDTENLILSPVNSIKAFTPYIVYSENGFTSNLTGTVNASNYPASDIVTAGYLKASVKAQTVTEGYVLQKQGGVVQFYKVNSEKPVNIPAGKCWAVLPQQLAAKAAFGITVDNTTGIASPNVGNTSANDCYTLDGIKVNQVRKGTIYINNGRKVIR